MIRRRPGFTMIELCVVVAIIAALIMLLLPAVQAAREAARRTQCVNNLMQLGVALQNYEATHQVLPPGVVDTKGPVVETPSSYQFGWICQILPYLDQKNIYRNLDINAGIYTPNNLTARSVVIASLICPSDSSRFGGVNSVQNFGAGVTNSAIANIPDPAICSYAACHHDVEAAIDSKNAGVFFLNSHVRLDEIEDGLGRTIFVGEKRPPGDQLGWASGTRATLRNTGTPINLTQLDPADLSLFLSSQAGVILQPDATTNPATSSPPPVRIGPIPVGGYGSAHPGGSNFLFGDGSVHFLRASIDPQVYQRLGNRADGELVGDDQF